MATIKPTKQQRAIELSYQRAMNIRDSLRLVPDKLESWYGEQYRRLYKIGGKGEFFECTRFYLKRLREAQPL